MQSINDKDNYAVLMKSALAEIKRLKAKLARTENQVADDIAIVGLSCRFPGANNPDEFWDLLTSGKNALSEIPKDRWKIDDYYCDGQAISNKVYIRHGYFINNVRNFDPTFFGITPREAVMLDPQQRLLLEVCYEALENAAIPTQSLKDSLCGVYIGMGSDDYSSLSFNEINRDNTDAYSTLGTSRSIAAGRIAYVFGLQGPVMQLDTSCSSSLVSIHLACQSLRLKECHLAIAGGVHLNLTALNTINRCKLKALAPDGKCKTFDASANGFGQGEGCGIIVLKRLTDAINAGDNIIAIIKGSAVNHDGASSGLTVPNQQAQEKLIVEVLQKTATLPNAIDYIEAHGTGTIIGDPIEMSSLTNVLGQKRELQKPLYVGSVKTNIGHLEAAAGIASIIKTALSLSHRTILPNLHFNKPNPLIPWDSIPIKVPTQTQTWNSVHEIRMAGVSSFGMSGTNGFILLAENLNTIRVDANKKIPALLTISAKSKSALKNLALKYRDYLLASPIIDFQDICYTALIGRNHYQERLAIIALDNQAAAGYLSAWLSDVNCENIYESKTVIQYKYSKQIFSNFAALISKLNSDYELQKLIIHLLYWFSGNRTKGPIRFETSGLLIKSQFDKKYHRGAVTNLQ